MPDERSGERIAQELSDRAAMAVLGVLLARHPALVAVDELVREVGEAPERHGLSEPEVRDGVADLVGDGLAHRLDRFVVASRAAVRAARLVG
jgi:hypothetical protein